ncbi:MAG: low temperature requirement protein A [Micromonosporaceae bacterium]
MGRRWPDPATVARVAWLEKLYDIVFVACVGRFANELGANPDLRHTLVVLGWLAGLWLGWFLVTMRLNRFPDEGWLTRIIVVAQLLSTTVAAAAAISVTPLDDSAGVVATAGIGLGIAALYATVPRDAMADSRLLAVPIVGSVGLAVATLLSLVLSRPAAVVLTSATGLAFLVVIFAYYLPRLTRNQPVEPGHAGDRHGQLFLVLLGLSFLKVAFVTDPRTGVRYVVVVSAFAVGFALWTLYVDGVLPLGFPTDPARQQPWLAAQFVLALAVTVAAAAVTVLPVAASGAVTVAGVLLEGGSLIAVMLAFAALALSAQHRTPRLAVSRGVWAGTFGVLMVVAVAGGMSDAAFSSVLAALIVVASAADAIVRHGADIAAPTG